MARKGALSSSKSKQKKTRTWKEGDKVTAQVLVTPEAEVLAPPTSRERTYFRDRRLIYENKHNKSEIMTSFSSIEAFIVEHVPQVGNIETFITFRCRSETLMRCSYRLGVDLISSSGTVIQNVPFDVPVDCGSARHYDRTVKLDRNLFDAAPHGELTGPEEQSGKGCR